MNILIVLNGRAIKQILLVLVVSLFTAWFLFTESIVHIPVFSESDQPKAIYKGEKDVALTFNIGWGDEKAEPILNILEKNNIRQATFFLSGSWAERHPDIVNRIVKKGYEIGILGYNYIDYTEVEEAKVRQDIVKAQTAFNKLNVKNIKLLRAPTGHFNQTTLKIAKQYGYTVVHWSIDSKDWTNPGVRIITKNVSKAKKGDIILLHASDSVKQTDKALPTIINDLQDKGLKLTTVSNMIANAHSISSEVK
ncbi:polysaccharide deacetylase family sporulation protein PdaB [Bacillus sp. 03113]|uniref:polysaccharide deacetylase family sporulation protein PdaB n=1 Tax=Bacillus sp. 03113 TaxID=2578211 RepID=UPI001142F836|nr:polysaccharide deacetylase family sporulation protein PdaB [Bacillus sp. 03113]